VSLSELVSEDSPSKCVGRGCKAWRTNVKKEGGQRRRRKTKREREKGGGG